LWKWLIVRDRIGFSGVADWPDKLNHCNIAYLHFPNSPSEYKALRDLMVFDMKARGLKTAGIQRVGLFEIPEIPESDEGMTPDFSRYYPPKPYTRTPLPSKEPPCGVVLRPDDKRQFEEIGKFALISRAAYADWKKRPPFPSDSLLPGWIEGFNPEPVQPIKPKQNPLGRRDLQIQRILEVIEELNFNPRQIPEGGKKTVETRCLEDAEMFTKDGFKKAWQEARNRSLIEVEGIDKYRSGRSGP